MNAEYTRLQHAMQSGVAADHSMGARDGEPKHLRVGVNTAMVETSAIIRLLIAKGVCTEEEAATALVEGMRAEVSDYEKRLSQKMGSTVSLA